MKLRAKTIQISVLLLILFSGSASLLCQNDASSFWANVRYGGGIGLSFGNRFFSATLAPSAIYEFDSRFAAGIGLNGTYSRERDLYEATVIGGSIITLYNIIPEVQLSAEFEQLNVNRNFDSDLFEDENYWSPAVFVGAGYRSQYVTVGIRYNLLFDEEDSIYANAWMPFVRVFF